MGAQRRIVDITATIGEAEGIGLRLIIEDRRCHGPTGDHTSSGHLLGLWAGSSEREEGDAYQWVNVMGPRGYIAAYAVWRGELCVSLPCHIQWPELDAVVASALGVSVRPVRIDASGMEVREMDEGDDEEDGEWARCATCGGRVPPERLWGQPGERDDGYCPGSSRPDGMCGAFASAESYED